MKLNTYLVRHGRTCRRRPSVTFLRGAGIPAQKMMIIGLLVLALVPGFVGVASAAPKVNGNCWIDDGTHTNTNMPYKYTSYPCIVNGVSGTKTTTANADAAGFWQSTITVATWTMTVSPPTGWSVTGGPTSYSVTPATSSDVITGKDFWLTPDTLPSFTPVSIVGTIEPGGSEQDTVTVTAGSEEIKQLSLEYNGPPNSFQVVTDPSGLVDLSPGDTQIYQVTINSKAGIDPGTYNFYIDVYDKNYYGSGQHRTVASIPVTKTIHVPAHGVKFTSTGLPDGTSVSVSYTKVNDQGDTVSNTVTFDTPGQISVGGTKPGSTFSYSFPDSITVGSDSYSLQGSSPASPFTTGEDGGTTMVTGTYVPACNTPSITEQPEGATKTVGQSVTFSVTASGTEPLSYQWQKDGADISGATGASYTISSVVVGDAGSYDVVVSNSCGSATSDEAALTVNKFTPTISWSNPAAITYGTELSTTQLNAEADVPGTLAYDPAAGTKLDVGSKTLHVDFTPADPMNYNGASADVTITVGKATPVIDWIDPADITYGTALSGTQLNAEVTGIDGILVYSPDTGTVLGAGPDQALHVDFTPADTANYNDASKDVSINVLKATPIITWNDPADITYGTALSDAQLDATADVPGSFTYSPVAGTVLAAGAGQTLHVDFIPADPANYDSAGKDVKITVLNPPPELSPIGDKTVQEGSYLDFAVSAYDPNGDTITYSADPLPDGATIDPISGSFFWAPASGQAGTYQVTFAASDGSLTDTETITITVKSSPTSGSYIAGGGYLVMSSSAGELAATPGTRNFFGLFVNCNKRAGPQLGLISVIFRSNGHVYRARSLIIDSLSADPNAGTATLTSRATIQDITKPKTPVVLERNAALKMTLTDTKTPGAKDSIGITLNKKDGGFWFSSNWDGKQTVEQDLSRGILVIR